MLGQVFFQRIDERPALDEELLGIRVLAVARFLEYLFDRRKVCGVSLAIGLQHLAIRVVAVGCELLVGVERRRKQLPGIGDPLVVALLFVLVPRRHVPKDGNADFEEGLLHQGDGFDRRDRVLFAVFDRLADRVRDPVTDHANDQEDCQRE